MKVFLVIQESNCDGEHLFNVTPCATIETAKKVMNDEIQELLSNGKYSGLNLDEIERDQNDFEVDCDYFVERNDTSFFLGMVYDDYYEKIDIIEKEVI